MMRNAGTNDARKRRIHVYGGFELEVEYGGQKIVLSLYEKKYGKPPMRKLFAKTTRSFKDLLEKVTNEKGVYILLLVKHRPFPLSRAVLYEVLTEIGDAVDEKL